MTITLALGLFLLGAAVGALLTKMHQTTVRKQFQQDLEAQIDQAFFGGLRRRKLSRISGIPPRHQADRSVSPEHHSNDGFPNCF